MNGACNGIFFLPRPLGRGQKVKYHLISITMSITKSISKIFIPNFVCVLANISGGILILSPGSCPRGGTWGCFGVKNSNSVLLRLLSVHYAIS